MHAKKGILVTLYIDKHCPIWCEIAPAKAPSFTLKLQRLVWAFGKKPFNPTSFNFLTHKPTSAPLSLSLFRGRQR